MRQVPPTTVAEVETIDEAAAAEPLHGRSTFGLSGAVDGVVVVLALLLVVAFVPPLIFDGWTPRFALVVATLPLGMTMLVLLVRQRHTTTIWLVVALAWTALVSLFSGAPRSALLGFAGRDLSALTVLGAAGVWALAQQTTERARSLVVDVVVWATALAASVGLCQVLFEVTTGPLALASGRPSSFMTNPVYFGAMASSALVVGASRLANGWRYELVPAVALLGIGVSISGSRVALGAALVAVALLLAVRRSGAAVASALTVTGALVAGVAVDRWFGAGRNAADRIAESSGGGRLTVWRYGWEAFLDDPLLGNGFGRFRPAVQERFEVDFVRQHALDESSQPWFDPHNVAIGLLVAVGIVGTVLFGVWAVRCAMVARGVLAWGIVPILLHWMLQPVSLYTMPLAAVLLGASMPAVRHRSAMAASGEAEEADAVDPAVVIPSARTAAVGVTVGALLGCVFLGGDIALRRAADAADAPRAANIAQLTGNDPVVSNLVAQVYALDVLADGHLDQVVEWRLTSTETEPDRPFWWTQLALAQIETEDYIGARRSLDEALRLQPNNPTTTRTMAILAIRSGDRELLADSLDRLCDFDLPDCELTVDELLGPDDESGE